MNKYSSFIIISVIMIFSNLLVFSQQKYNAEILSDNVSISFVKENIILEKYSNFSSIKIIDEFRIKGKTNFLYNILTLSSFSIANIAKNSEFEEKSNIFTNPLDYKLNNDGHGNIRIERIFKIRNPHSKFSLKKQNIEVTVALE